MNAPVIALVSDFGVSDHYVGTMKGVILNIVPGATIVDITHGIEPQDILGGALQLAAAYRYFPNGTIFVAVIDPGVGSSRRAIAGLAGGCVFVAPDNGVLTPVFDEVPPERIVELRESNDALRSVSRTFEGRDRFAPAAAWLARGIDLEALGPAVTDWVRLDIPRPSVTADAISGQVLQVDRFGNLVTNIPGAPLLALARGGPLTITAGSHAVASLCTSYAEMPGGQLCAIVGSGDCVEISVKSGSAAGALGAGRGLPVSIRRAQI